METLYNIQLMFVQNQITIGSRLDEVEINYKRMYPIFSDVAMVDLFFKYRENEITDPMMMFEVFRKIESIIKFRKILFNNY